MAFKHFIDNDGVCGVVFDKAHSVGWDLEGWCDNCTRYMNLIAVSPDLLEACKMVVDAYENNPQNISEAVLAAKLAIEKAGQQGKVFTPSLLLFERTSKMSDENNQQIIQTEQEMWAIVELMGHGQTAGRITKPTEWGGLMRVDVPCDDDGHYITEFYGIPAIYRIKFVSEEIARAYAPRSRVVTAYDAPIVTREQHQSIVNQLENDKYELRGQVRELERRLTQINALPSGETEPDNGPDF